MILRFAKLLALVLFAQSICAYQFAPVKPRDELEFVRKMSRLLAYRSKLKENGDGLLLLWLSNAGQRKYSNLAVKAEFTSSIGGKPINLDAQIGAISLLRLPAGRYCLTGILVGPNHFKNKCEVPYFDVTANSVDISGLVEIRLGWNKLRIVDRRMNEMIEEMPISELLLSQLHGYFEEQAKSNRITLFASGPMRQPFIVRLYPDNSAEIEYFSLANANYTQGAWENSAGYEISSNNGDAKYFVDAIDKASSAKFVRGLSEDASRQRVEFMERLAFAPNVDCWSWKRCGNRITPGIVAEADFNFFNSALTLRGEVELTYQLKPSNSLAMPTNVRLINHTMSRELAEAIAKRFEETVFMPEKNATGVIRRCQIRFEAIGSRARAIYTDLP